MSKAVQFLFERAAKARQLAQTLPDEEAVATLLKLADLFDALAREQVERERGQKLH